MQSIYHLNCQHYILSLYTVLQDLLNTRTSHKIYLQKTSRCSITVQPEEGMEVMTVVVMFGIADHLTVPDWSACYSLQTVL